MGVLGGSASASSAYRADSSPWEQLCVTSGATPGFGPGVLACSVLTSAGGLDETWVERLSGICERRYKGIVERTVVGTPPYDYDYLYCWLSPSGV